VPARRQNSGTWELLNNGDIRTFGFRETAKRFQRIDAAIARDEAGDPLAERINERNKLTAQVFPEDQYLVFSGAGGGIGGCEFNAITRDILPVSGPQLGEPDARLLEILIERYGVKRKHSAKVENQQLERAVWGDKGSDDNLYKSAEHLRAAFGEERRSYILSKPVRLAVKPELIPDDERSNDKGAFLDVPDSPKRDHPKQLAKSSSPKLDLNSNLNRAGHLSSISAIGISQRTMPRHGRSLFMKSPDQGRMQSGSPRNSMQLIRGLSGRSSKYSGTHFSIATLH
jgi:hypothetical protein